MIPGGVNELLLRSAAAGGATAGRSVRFNSADSAYLSRTPASAGNRKTWTWSGWVKKARNDQALEALFANCDSTGNFFDYLGFASDSIRIYGAQSGSYDLTTTPVFRDLSAWYHIVLAFDSTQATASNRVKLYINGTQVTSFASSSYPALNYETRLNTTVLHTIARFGELSPFYYFSGYLALVHFIDGQALTPSSFGETSATTGQWIAKAYSGTYGTNGFFLDFLDNSTAAALGYDAAGSNDWTVNNLSVTAGSGNDSLRDHPTSAGTDTGIGGEISGNYCTFNPLDTSLATATLLNGNLDYSSSVVDQGALGTFGLNSGKWYWEVVTTAGTTQTRAGIWDRGSGQYYFSLSANNTVYGIRFNADAGTLDYTSNGSTWTSIATGLASGSYFPYFENRGTTSKTVSVNFGQRAFTYTAPTNYKVVCDANLPTPTIAKPNTVMDVVLYTGNGSTQTISGLGFSPDFVWIKHRNSGAGGTHRVFDTVRGAGNRLFTNNRNAESYSSLELTAFNSDGFSLEQNTGVNQASNPFVSWTWDAGSSNATNTSGSITSTVRANISAGFSVVTYTGTGSNATVGHGLGLAPSMILIKSRSAATDWMVYHISPGATKRTSLHLTDAFSTDNTAFNDTAPTSSVFSLGTNSDLNNNGSTYVAYCWAPVSFYSSFGQYTGNGSSDGPFVYTGLRPAVVLVKMSSSTGNWTILDDKREGYNVDNDPLYPNLSDAEGTTDLIDITSNGFKVRTTDATFNTNAGTYIYAAWASAPFPYSRAR